MPAQGLADRAVIAVEGTDAATFLQGLVTADVACLAGNSAVSAALLTPQGKILFDMLIARAPDGFLIDCDGEAAEPLARRLGFYRLRAKVDVTPCSDLSVVWSPVGAEPPQGVVSFADPRLPALGSRTIGAHAAEAEPSAYHACRIAAGVAEAGPDYDSETVFPHEANLDLLHGVDFAKGCFVGQEVVSRMQHRGTARKRFLPCEIDGPVPARDADVNVGDRTIGTVGSSSASHALALLRLDRLAAAEREGKPVTAGPTRLVPMKPDWMPTEAFASEAAE